MKGYPNTYALSKILAEDLVYSFRDKFPTLITRPSIVISAYSEPYPGWVESKKSGLAGILLSRGRGVLRTIFSDPDKLLEFIPVDVANNAILALTCKRALMRETETMFINLTNSSPQKWTLKQFFDYEMEVVKQYPLDLLLWWPYCPLTKNRFYYEYRRFCYHYLPGFIGDTFCRLSGEKPLYAWSVKCVNSDLITPIPRFQTDTSSKKIRQGHEDVGLLQHQRLCLE